MKTALVFDHLGRTKAGKEGLIEVRVTHQGKPYYISTDVRVRGSEFRHGEIINRGDAAVLNERLDVVVARIERAVTRCIMNGDKIDVAAIKKRIYEVEDEESKDSTSLIDWIDEQIDMLNVSEGTRNHYKVMAKRLRQFGKLNRWQDVTTESIYEWDAWLHKLPKPQSKADVQAGRERECISSASVHNYHKDLKSLLSRAVKMGKIEQNPYDRLRGEFKKCENESTEFLTEEEMKALESLHPLPGTQMAMARDLFVFQMYTGLSYSDSQAFDIKDYKQVNGKWMNVGERIKTGVAYVSQLLPPVVEILERYNWQTPKINNTQYNLSLKVIQQALGFTSKLHSHLARHTFATWMLSNGVPLEHVSKMVGHSNIRQTQRYAKVMATAVYDDFERVAEKMKKKTGE
jgi:integrase